MLDATAATPDTTRLHALLERCTSGVGDEATAEARSLGPEIASYLVASAVEAELSRPTGGPAAIRAAHLAHELRLARAEIATAVAAHQQKSDPPSTLMFAPVMYELRLDAKKAATGPISLGSPARGRCAG